MPCAVPLLQSWKSELSRTTDPDKPGRSLRGRHAHPEEFGYAPASGRAELLVDGWASHPSALQEGDLEVEFEAEFRLLQLEDPAAEVDSGMFTAYPEVLGNLDAPIED